MFSFINLSLRTIYYFYFIITFKNHNPIVESRSTAVYTGNAQQVIEHAILESFSLNNKIKKKTLLKLKK